MIQGVLFDHQRVCAFIAILNLTNSLKKVYDTGHYEHWSKSRLLNSAESYSDNKAEHW